MAQNLCHILMLKKITTLILVLTNNSSVKQEKGNIGSAFAYCFKLSLINKTSAKLMRLKQTKFKIGNFVT